MNPLYPIALGTLFGVCLVIFALTAAGLAVSLGVSRAARELWSAKPSPDPATETVLPPPVARYMEVCRAAGRKPVKSARLRHGGRFSPAPGRDMAIAGAQYISADPPGFVWWGRIKLAPFVHADARDSSILGVGRMLVKAAGFLTVGDSKGETMDEGAVMRLLGELVWLPTALADSRYVKWSAIDENAAAAKITVGSASAALVFRFGPDNLVRTVEGLRWRDTGNGSAALTPWYGVCGDYRDAGGMLVPFSMSANWIYDGKAHEYARWEVEAVEYEVKKVW